MHGTTNIKSSEIVSSSKCLSGVRSVFLRHIVQYKQIKCKLLLNSHSMNYGCFWSRIREIRDLNLGFLLGCPSEYTDSREMPTLYLQIRQILPLPTLSAHRSWTNLFLTVCYVTPAVEAAPSRQYCFHFYAAKWRCGRSITRDRVTWWLRVLLHALYL